jgi:hypothetical protein
VSELSNPNPNIRTVIAPESPVTSGGTLRVTEQEAPEEKSSPKKKILAGLAGLTLAAIAATGIGLGVAGNGEEPAKVPATSEPVGEPTSETPATPEALPTVESLEIDGSIINDPEKIVDQFIEGAIPKWLNSGSGVENAQTAFGGNGIIDHAIEVGGQYDSLFIDAYAPDNWEETGLETWVEGIIETHSSVLALNYGTTPELNIDSRNTEAYTIGVEVLSIESFTTNEDGSVTLVTLERAYDNDDKNIANTQIKGDELTVTRVFDNIEGKLKLISIRG